MREVEAFALGVLRVDPAVFYWMTPRELNSAARGHRMAEDATLIQIRTAVWGDAKDVRAAMGIKAPHMTEDEYRDLKSRIEGEA